VFAQRRRAGRPGGRAAVSEDLLHLWLEALARPGIGWAGRILTWPIEDGGDRGRRVPLRAANCLLPSGSKRRPDSTPATASARTDDRAAAHRTSRATGHAGRVGVAQQAFAYETAEFQNRDRVKQLAAPDTPTPRLGHFLRQSVGLLLLRLPNPVGCESGLGLSCEHRIEDLIEPRTSREARARRPACPNASAEGTPSARPSTVWPPDRRRNRRRALKARPGQGVRARRG